MLAKSEHPSTEEDRVKLEDFDVVGDEKRRMSEKRRVFLWRCWWEDAVQRVVAEVDVETEDILCFCAFVYIFFVFENRRCYCGLLK